MDKEKARTIISLATSMDPYFQQMFALLEGISDEDLKIALKNSLGIALQNITVGVVFSLEKIFPDLKVD